jgi:hypothetical protein
MDELNMPIPNPLLEIGTIPGLAQLSLEGWAKQLLRAEKKQTKTIVHFKIHESREPLLTNAVRATKR